MSATAPPKLPRGSALRVTGEIAPGTVLDGKYRIDSVLGRGGMAIVFAAKHVTLGHPVAIKVMKPDAGASPQQAERIVREARAAAGLSSENATRVLDIGALDSGQPYIVMEQLVGVDLAQLLLERGQLTVRDAASYLVQACDAVAEAHAREIVHRDLKPSNLFLTTRREGTPLVKLMDFGISKLVSEQPEASLTATHDSLGTPHYMSPEQLMTSREVDTRTDVWALGVILYRLLTGEHPFVGETTPAVHVAVASGPAPKLGRIRPDAPREIEQLIVDCLVKSRTERLQTVQAFATVLLPFADEDTRRRYAHLAGPMRPPAGTGVTPVDVAIAAERLAVSSPDPETRAAWGTGRSRQSGRTRRGALVLGLGTLAVGAVAFVVALGSLRPAGSPSLAAPSAIPGARDSAPATGAATEDPPSPPSASSLAAAPSASLQPALSSSAVRGGFSTRPRPRSSTPAAPAPTSPKLDPYGQRR